MLWHIEGATYRLVYLEPEQSTDQKLGTNNLEREESYSSSLQGQNVSLALAMMRA